MMTTEQRRYLERQIDLLTDVYKEAQKKEDWAVVARAAGAILGMKTVLEALGYEVFNGYAFSTIEKKED